MLRLSPPTTVSRALKPLLILLWISGCFTVHFKSKSRLQSTIRRLLNIVFVSLNVLAHVCHVSFHVLGLVANIRAGKNLIPSLYTSTFAFGMLYVSIAVPMTTPKHLRKLLTQLDKYSERNHGARDYHNLQKFIVLIIVVNIMMVPLPYAVNEVVKLAGIDNVTCIALAENDLDLPIPLPQVASSYSSFTFSSVWIESCILCFIVLFNVNIFVKDIELIKQEILEECPRLLEDLRLRHESLCKLIRQTSQVIGHVIAAVYLSGIPCFLFLLHGFVYRQLALYEFLRMTFFFGQLTFTLTYLTIAGTVLNIKMHKPAEFLFPLNIEKMPGRGPEIVAAFLARLQGAPIGFTVYRLFTIDTSTILMVCGTILTYAVVIIQFQPGISGTPTFTAPPSTAAIPNLSPGLAEPALNTSV